MMPGQVLIVSDDSEFVQALVASWRTERDSPSITSVSAEASQHACPSGYDLAVVGPLRGCTECPSPPALPADAMICAVGDDESLSAVHAKHGEWLLLPEYPGWKKLLFSLAREISRRTIAEAWAREAEISSLSQKRLGILGKSLLEARPGMVNALTSLLGNADLILLSEEPMPNDCQEHVRTIHTMALRLKEIVQRLCSLESEMGLSERKSHPETAEMRLAETRHRD